MKTTILFVISLVLVILSFTLPIYSTPPGGLGQWPCAFGSYYNDQTGNWDLDCRGNSGDCICILFVY